MRSSTGIKLSSSLVSPTHLSACDRNMTYLTRDMGERRKVRAHVWLMGPSLPLSGRSCMFSATWPIYFSAWLLYSSASCDENPELLQSHSDSAPAGGKCVWSSLQRTGSISALQSSFLHLTWRERGSCVLYEASFVNGLHTIKLIIWISISVSCSLNTKENAKICTLS